MRKIPPPLSPFVVDAVDDELHVFFTEDLAKSGLSPADVPSWYPVRGEGIGRFTRMGASVPSGYAIPYFSMDGAPQQDCNADFVRFRLRTPLSQTLDKDGTIKNGAKYLSAKDSAAHLYVPAATAKLLCSATARADLPLVITEGEKKAEAVVKHTGIPCVALAGIYMWLDPESDKRDALAQRKLHPELLAVVDAYTQWVEGKPVVLVVFDSDGAIQKSGSKASDLAEVRDRFGKPARVRNADVFRAGLMLSNRLYAEQQMAVATSASWCPEGPDGAKQGLDDWLVSSGADTVSAALMALSAKPDNKILNKHGLPAHVLTNNNDKDVEILASALRKHEDLYVFGSSPAIIEPASTSIYVVDHEVVLAKEVSKLVQTFEEKENGGLRPCYVPQHLCKAMILRDWQSFPGMRRVDAMTQHPLPMLLGDEVYVSRAGYDDRAQLFGAFDDQEWTVPVQPSFDEFVAAVDTLGELISEMYLQSPADVSAAIAAMLTAVCRPGLPVAPGFVLSAPNSGAGKSYFAQVLTELASVHEPDVLTLETRGPNANSEFSKMVLGALSTSRPVMLFDEIDDNKIDGPSLRKLITSPVFSGRKLGANAVLTLPTRKLVLITANNVDPTMDSARRFIIVRINPPTDAAKRNQRPDRGAVDLVHEDRVRFARAAVIVSLGGMHMLKDSAFRMPVGINMLSGFPAWSRVVAGPALLATWLLIKREREPVNLVECDDLVAIAGKNPLREQVEEINPMLRQKQTLQMDPARLALRDLLEAMYRFQSEKVPGMPDGVKLRGPRGEQGFTTDLMVAELREQRHLSEKYQRDYGTEVTPQDFALLQELRASGLRDDQMSNNRSLGKVLSGYRDREVGGFSLLQLGRITGVNSTLWHVRKVDA
jgi:hypothetical protein